MIKILGVSLHKPDKTDILPIGVATLIGLLLIYPFSFVMAPKTILSWVFAWFTGAILSSMGVKAREGLRHIALIVLCSLPMALLGHFVGLSIVNMLA
jgi:hypothetical protein